MDHSADADKIMRIQVSFDRYSKVMQDLRKKKQDVVMEYRKKIDAARVVVLEPEPERTLNAE